jgi:fructose-1,6-bisphosphatase/inositol monophosphatase family enzyme
VRGQRFLEKAEENRIDAGHAHDVGVLYDLYLDRMYEAALGEGASANGVPLRVSDTLWATRLWATSVWDIAAVKVLVEEAGGQVTDIDGNSQRYDQPIRGALLSNKRAHDDFVELVRPHLFDGTSRRKAVSPLKEP